MKQNLSMSAGAKAAQDYFQEHKSHFLNQLIDLAKIPSISFDGFDPTELDRSAAAVVAQMKEAGLEHVEILKLPGAHPYIYGDWLNAPGKPTVLLYAHHDVQPIGDEAKWKSPPFVPTKRDGRLYGRGTADDKAGISVHLAAIASYLQTQKTLPLNVKVLIDGEEEIGSVHLGDVLKAYREKFSCDAMILTDTDNFETGLPTLTVSLRGLVATKIEVKALGHSLHSGMWGGPVPDPAMALAKMLASLTDEEGRLAIPGIWKDVRSLSSEEQAKLDVFNKDVDTFREQASVLPGVPLRPGRDGHVHVYQQIWREPAVTVNAIQVSDRLRVANIISASAWAKVSIRIVPSMNPEQTLELLLAHLKRVCPWGLQVDLQPDEPGRPWETKPSGPAFEAAHEALKIGYGREPVYSGCGGSIPFVDPLAQAMGGVPALLMGVEDPYSNAHSENESLHLGDWEKAIASAIAFYDLYGRI